MNKISKEININYEYHADRKGAKYTLDGEHFMNGGEFKECLCKAVLGYEATKDANTRFDKGDDLPELHASIKSWNCGLTDMKLSDEPETFLEKFWAMSDKTQNYIWVSVVGEIVNLYMMNHNEFVEFTNEFAKWDGYAKKFRFKTCENKVNAWLDSKIA